MLELDIVITNPETLIASTSVPTVIPTPLIMSPTSIAALTAVSVKVTDEVTFSSFK